MSVQTGPNTNVWYHLSLSESDWLMLLPDITPSQTLFFGCLRLSIALKLGHYPKPDIVFWVSAAFHRIEIGATHTHRVTWERGAD